MGLKSHYSEESTEGNLSLSKEEAVFFTLRDYCLLLEIIEFSFQYREKQYIAKMKQKA